MADAQRLVRCPVCLNEAAVSSGFGRRVSCRACGGSFALDSALPALKKEPTGKSEMIDFSLIESGARGYLSRVYLGVSSAILISAITVHAARVVPLLNNLVCAEWHLVIFVIPVVIAAVLGKWVRTMHPALALLGLGLYAIALGIGLAGIDCAFPRLKIVQALVVVAAVIALAGIYGLVLRRELSRLAIFVFLGLTGLLGTAFLIMVTDGREAFLLSSVVAIVVLAAVAAYLSTPIKDWYREMAPGGSVPAVLGALWLYVGPFHIITDKTEWRRLETEFGEFFDFGGDDGASGDSGGGCGSGCGGCGGCG